MSEGRLAPEEAAALEALLDPRLGEAVVAGALAARVAGREPADLVPFTSERPIEWATRTLRQGDILASFAAHCRHDLADVEVIEETDLLLVARWKREVTRLELRAGLLGIERLASAQPTLLLADLDREDADALAERFAGDAALRSAVAVFDLARLEKLGAVRSSVAVYLEWFLRDAYGVKLLTSAAFTQGLIARGVISLGFG